MKWSIFRLRTFYIFFQVWANPGFNRVYEGETGRSARLRGTEHFRDFKNKKSGSVLYKHKELEHTEEDIEVGMKIDKSFKDALTRQANEAVRINSRKFGELLNSKNEFNHPAIPRIIVDRK